MRLVLKNGLAALQVDLNEVQVELFASWEQHIMQLYWSRYLNTAYRTHRHCTTQPLQQAPANAGKPWQPYNLCYRAWTLARWPHRAHSSQVSRTGATTPTPPKSISVKEREGDPDTDLSFCLTSLSHKPDMRWNKAAAQHTRPTGPPAPASEHGNITPCPACRAMQDPPPSEHIILENVTSTGRRSRD